MVHHPQELVARAGGRWGGPDVEKVGFAVCWLLTQLTQQQEAQAQQRVLALVDKVGMPTAEAPPSGEGEGEDE